MAIGLLTLGLVVFGITPVPGQEDASGDRGAAGADDDAAEEVAPGRPSRVEYPQTQPGGPVVEGEPYLYDGAPADIYGGPQGSYYPDGAPYYGDDYQGGYPAGEYPAEEVPYQWGPGPEGEYLDPNAAEQGLMGNTPGIARFNVMGETADEARSRAYYGNRNVKGKPNGPDCLSPSSGDYRFAVFGEYLMWQPRGSNLAYGIPRNGAVPLGAVGVVDPQYDVGIRAGGAFSVGPGSSIYAAYTMFNSEASSFTNRSAPQFVRSLVLHPATLNALSNYPNIFAQHDIDLMVIDAGYKGLLFGGQDYSISGLANARYAEMDQDARILHNLSPVSSTVLQTNIAFDGLGAGLGIDGEKKLGSLPFWVYGKGMASVLSGRFTNQYHQFNAFNGLTDAYVGWRDDRLVPIIEYELGIAWVNAPRGGIRVSAGYSAQTWFNTITTESYIQAAQSSNFNDVSDVLSFNGLVGRIELRY